MENVEIYSVPINTENVLSSLKRMWANDVDGNGHSAACAYNGQNRITLVILIVTNEL